MPRRHCLAAALIALSCPAFADTVRYEAVWHQGQSTSLTTAPLSRQAFIDSGQGLVAQGLRLIDVETALVDGNRRYVGLWTQGSGSNIFDGPMGPIDMRKALEARRAQGMRLTDFEIFRTPSGGRRYVGVWASGSAEEILTGPMEEAAFLARGEQHAADGLRLIDVEVEVVNGTLLYHGLFRTGTGSNFLTTPLARLPVRMRRNQMVADGLVDVERIFVDGRNRFVGVWSSGPGESRLSAPREFGPFFIFAQAQFNVDKHTRDIELRVIETPDGDGDDGGTGGGDGPTTADLPDPPAWIEVSGGDRLVLDFGTIVDNHPRLTLPTSTQAGPLDYLPDYLPRQDDGALVIPNNFCGIKVRKAASFQWQKDGATITDFPYNRVDDVFALPGEHDFLDGIEFTGPIGACAEDNEPWQFFQPLTQHGGDSPVPGMKLVIEMRSESEIIFLNHNIHVDPDGLRSHELFSDKVFEELEAIAKAFEFLKVDNGYCSIDQYVMKVCEESPINCLVTDDFTSPC